MRVIIIGGDQTAYYLTRQFMRKDYHITLINSDVRRSHELAARTGAIVVLGDGTDVSRLEEAGARQADIVIALTPRDQDNLIACQIARRNFGVPRTIAMVNDPDNEEIFQKLGIDVAFSPTRVIGSIIEQQTTFDDITTLMPLAQGRVNLTDVHLDRESPAVGKSLIELKLSDDALIACIIRDDEVIVPRGSTRLQVSDHLILITQPETQHDVLQTLCGTVEIES